jgi:hypothetical protein
LAYPKWYHPSPQQRYFGAQKPKKRAKVLLFFELAKCFFVFYKKKYEIYTAWCGMAYEKGRKKEKIW